MSFTIKLKEKQSLYTFQTENSNEILYLKNEGENKKLLQN